MRRSQKNAGTSRLRNLAALAVCLLLLLTACGGQGIGGSGTVIDWVDFVKLNGITYMATMDGRNASLTDAALGPIYATVRHMLNGNVNDPDYHSQDGDAAFLPTGTPVYEVKGYAPKFRLAAHRANRIVLYEADTNPQAKSGADLLDIAGKVRSIAVVSDQDGTTQLGAIANAAQVQSLTAMALAAPIDQARQPPNGLRYFIAFNLADGTVVQRAYWPATGLMVRGILLPPAFAAAVAQAVGK